MSASTFKQAVFNQTTTSNGADSFKSTDCARVDLFFSACRGLSQCRLEFLLDSAWEESPSDTLKLIFNLRDCRGAGKGERGLFRWAWMWLVKRGGDGVFHATRNIHNVPFYGRFDDLFATAIHDVRNKQYFSKLSGYIAKQLKLDLKAMKESKQVSLLAKWVPSEKSALAHKSLVNHAVLCSILGIANSAEFRREYLSPLRAHINLVERQICAGDWPEVKYEHVPSCALRKYRKAFQKHDQERFDAWVESVVNGKSSVNAKVLFPHELIRDILKLTTDSKTYKQPSEQNEQQLVQLKLLQCQWDVLVEKARKQLGGSNSLVVVDVSGSMYGKIQGCKVSPLWVSIAMGLLLSEANTSESFHDLLVSFSSTPSFINVSEQVSKWKRRNPSKSSMPSIVQRVCAMLECNECMGFNTNLQAVFSAILSRALRVQLKEEEMPSRVYIITDMQFDIVEGKPGTAQMYTNLDAIRDKFTKAGYACPDLVFWNVNGQLCEDVPVPVSMPGGEGVGRCSPIRFQYRHCPGADVMWRGIPIHSHACCH